MNSPRRAEPGAPRRCIALLAAAALAAPALASETASPPSFNLSALPDYKMVPKLQGVVRIWGNDQINLMSAWENEFQHLYKEVRFQDFLLTTGVGFAGIVTGEAEIAYMGHRLWRSDVRGYQQFFGYPPLEIRYANGALDSPNGSTHAPVFFVHKDNPLAKLTLEQLDGIYGAERNGGYTRDGRWTHDAARGSEKNIRTWGQLGLTGAWADKPIKVVGLDAILANWSDLIGEKIFKGGTKFNPEMREIVRGGVETPADELLVKAVADDPTVIGYSFANVVKAANLGVKVLPLARTAAGPYVMPTPQTLHDETYPMGNSVYLYVNRKPGTPLAPRIKEFLTYVLSKQGQEKVAADGVWIPLTAEAAAIERKKLD